MKTSIRILAMAVAVILICLLPSCDKGNNTTNYCTDRILDGHETEIDCGGSCNPCPSVEAMSATYDGNPYVASSISVNYSSSTDAFSLNSTGTGGATVGFAFVNTNPGVSSVTGATVDISGSYYTMNNAQPGSVTVTSKDSLRNIITGTFSINMINSTTTLHSTLTGSFTNVRMQ